MYWEWLRDFYLASQKCCEIADAYLNAELDFEKI